MGNSEKQANILIGEKEAFFYADNSLGIAQLDFAKRLIGEWQRRYISGQEKKSSPIFDVMCLVATAFEAGRIHQKREERKRKATQNSDK